MKKKSRIWIYPLVIMVGFLMLTNGCKKKDTPTFPVLTTVAISNITINTSSGGGDITSDGGSTVTSRGVCWSTGQTPTIDDSKTTNGTGTGSFTSALTGLTANTTYYVRAYAANSAGIGYGSIVSFKTLPVLVPVLTTAAISNITLTTSSSGGAITSDGGSTVTVRGVCWGTGQTPTVIGSKTIDGSGTGSFTSAITGLIPNTTYYARAYATNVAGTGYGSAVPFNTLTGQIPVLSTVAISNITQTTSSSGGNITSDGGATVTARGVCWGTGQTPTTADSKTTDGSGTGSFTSAITGLTANTVYYARAYATNAVGTGYGSAISFTTQQESTTTVTDVEGNVYPIITIGTQVWMAANLKTTKYRDGSNIAAEPDSAAWISLTSDAYCNYANSASIANIYGKLYNWYAVNNSRNIAPTGWHVPTDAEWTTLATYLGGESVAGGALKETGLTHWLDPNTGATNTSGFTGLPGAKRDAYGSLSLGLIGYWWSSTEEAAAPTKSWHWILFGWNGTMGRDDSQKFYGMSVRCVKD